MGSEMSRSRVAVVVRGWVVWGGVGVGEGVEGGLSSETTPSGADIHVPSLVQ